MGAVKRTHPDSRRRQQAHKAFRRRWGQTTFYHPKLWRRALCYYGVDFASGPDCCVRIKPLVNNPRRDGFNPHFCVIDEMHEYKPKEGD